MRRQSRLIIRAGVLADQHLSQPHGSPIVLDNANGWCDAIGYATHRRRLHDTVIRVYDGTGNVIETREHKGDFKEA
jgi:hypothetical protein